MAEQLFRTELGYSIEDENGNEVHVIITNGAPGGTTESDAAPLGSLALDFSAGLHYRKKTAGSGLDKWEDAGTSSALTNLQNELDALEAAIGGVVDANGDYVAHTGSNYIDGNTSITEDLLDLDAAVAAAADTTEVDNIEAALGAMVDASGNYVPHTTSNYINGNSDVTEDLLDLDAQILANFNASLKLDGSNAMGADINAGGFKVTNMADGTNPTDAVTKQQLDAAQAGLLVKGQCDYATVEPLATTVGGAVTTGGSGVGKTLDLGVASVSIDGSLLNDGDRILVKDEATQSDNGIYDVSGVGVNIILTRSSDFDGNPAGEVKAGNFTFIDSGTVNGKTGWTLTELGLVDPNNANVDTDSLNFTQFQGLPQYIAGTGLDLTGDTFSVNLGAGIGETPSDHVGVDVHANGGLQTTVDGTTQSSLNTSQLGIKLADGSLELGAGGLKVNDNVLNEIDAIEAALGAAVDGNGNYVAFTGTNYIDGNSNIAEDLTDLDAAIGGNASAIGGLNSSISTLQGELDDTQVGAGLGTDGSYSANAASNYLKAGDFTTAALTESLFNADQLLDAQIKINTDAIAALQSGSTEDGYIRDFIGKTGTGVELPDYTSTNVVADNDNLVAAISKLDTEIGGVNSNEFFITNSDPLTKNLSDLDDALQDLGGQIVNAASSASWTTIDTVETGEYVMAKWLVHFREGQNVVTWEVDATHNAGDGGTPAATQVDFTKFAKLRIGANPGTNVRVTLSGTDMALQVKDNGGNATVNAIRTQVADQ